VIHAPGQVGALKVDSAAEAVKTISPRVEVIPYRGRLDGANATEIVTGYDVVVDGLDNASARYALSDATARRAIPLVFAAVYEFEGQVSVLNAPDGPCYRCLHTAPPPPIVSPACTLVPAVIGGLQAIEAIKLVARVGRPLIGRLLIYDARESRFTELRFTREPACHICFARTEKS
jgi:adenylyltransferase/sulfurtransferase